MDSIDFTLEVFAVVYFDRLSKINLQFFSNLFKLNETFTEYLHMK